MQRVDKRRFTNIWLRLRGPRLYFAYLPDPRHKQNLSL